MKLNSEGKKAVEVVLSFSVFIYMFGLFVFMFEATSAGQIFYMRDMLLPLETFILMPILLAYCIFVACTKIKELSRYK